MKLKKYKFKFLDTVDRSFELHIQPAMLWCEMKNPCIMRFRDMSSGLVRENEHEITPDVAMQHLLTGVWNKELYQDNNTFQYSWKFEKIENKKYLILTERKYYEKKAPVEYKDCKSC